jgi:hypothetical protein
MQASAGAVAPLRPDLAQTYHQGFVDALAAVAVAFGVMAPSRRHVECQWFPAERDDPY